MVCACMGNYIQVERVSSEFPLFQHIITCEGGAVIPAEVFRVLGFFSSPGLPSVLVAETQMVSSCKVQNV